MQLRLATFVFDGKSCFPAFDRAKLDKIGDTSDPAIRFYCELAGFKRLRDGTGLTINIDVGSWPVEVIERLQIIDDARLAYQQSRETSAGVSRDGNAAMLAAAAARQAQG